MIGITSPYVETEDFTQHYRYLCVQDKVVLDIGAFNGDTASFFLDHGAKRVIAVEPDDEAFRLLLENCMDDERVFPIHAWFDHPDKIHNWIVTYHPDCTKIDCEGGELYLLACERDILRSCEFYAIELHLQFYASAEVLDNGQVLTPDMIIWRLIDKLLSAGFQVWYDIAYTPCLMLYATLTKE